MSLLVAGAHAQQSNDPNRPAGTGQQQPAQPGQGTDRPDARGADWPMQEKKENTAQGRNDDRKTDGDMTANSFESQLRQIAQNPENAGDRLFVLCASKANTAEVEMARRAMQKTQDPEIKRVAQTLIDDHTKANEKLSKVASELNVQPITSLPTGKQTEAEVLFSLPNEQFNKAYLSHLKACHAAAISKYQDQVALSQNSAVKNYAQETLTHLNHHNQMISQAAQQAGLPAVAGASMAPAGD
ncbi:MAG TPA: DUF4142 domain-containing protein [Tepidisphaeraceae bacterium]|nr:DUF4142 domain-containing protein [Tepidisphaeraceae bacterium]